ncbi:MAG: inositol monophosphatase family protein [Pseudomonadota bacterium]
MTPPNEKPFTEFLANPFAGFAVDLANVASAETLPRFRVGTEYQNKSADDFDPVTDADREAEREIRRLIEARYPDHGIIGEEFGQIRRSADYVWILDPVDGTRAFVCGVASWTTLIALRQRQALSLGMIDQPFLGEQWMGNGKEAVYRRGDDERVARASSCTTISEARITTTDPRDRAYFSEEQSSIFDLLADEARVARFGFDAYGYGLLALGQFDIVMEAGLALHDYASLIPIIEGAGGIVTNWSGQPVGSDDATEILACATTDLHEEVLDRIATYRRLSA